ncbi:MAG TPA: DUF4136 domain-containing protein [Thermoanaerobaculia bacterium]|nr:DUF4136 domain-containing protein [Thermoanaerobaculia bacterium]
MRTRVLALMSLFVLLGATLAGAAKIRSNHDPNFDFSKVKTYRFKLEKGHPNEDLDRRIRAEIRAQLTKKGLRELPAGEEPADLLVTYAAGSADSLVPGGWFVEYDDWSGGPVLVPGDLSTVTGGLLIEMGDPKSGKLVWSASYIMRGNNPGSLQVMASNAEKAVRGALKKYPPR